MEMFFTRWKCSYIMYVSGGVGIEVFNRNWQDC